MSFVLRFRNGLSAVVRTLMAASTALMCVTIAASVFARNFFGLSFDAVVDVNRILFVWTTFLGLVYVNGEGKLIRFELIEQNVGENVRRILIIVQRLAGLVLFAVMATAGVAMFPFAQAQVFPTLPISLFWLYLPVSVSGALLILQTIASFAAPNEGKPC